MEIHRDGGRPHKDRRALGAIAGTLLMAAACAALAQTAPAGTATEDQAPSEAARRAALSPYRFILQNATAPRKAAPVPKPVTAEPAAAQPKPPIAPPVQQAAIQPPASVPAAEAAPAAPQPAVAALSRPPIEPPAPPQRREIIPIRTDEPQLSRALLREQPHGIVKVHFEVEPDGSVGEVTIVSSTNRALNKPSVDAVQGWKFQPVDEVLGVETELVYKMDN